MNIETIKKFLDTNYPKNQGFFIFGSKIYGTAAPDSDIDLVIIDEDLNGSSAYRGGLDLNFVSLELFLKQLKECDPRALECYFSPLKYLKFTLPDITLENLRSAFSQKSSHSYVKAKKKFLDQEIYTGKKSLFHSLRILDFGIQLGTHKKIKDFSSMNPLFFAIITHPNDPQSLEELLNETKKEYNRLHSEFKKISPKL